MPGYDWDRGTVYWHVGVDLLKQECVLHTVDQRVDASCLERLQKASRRHLIVHVALRYVDLGNAVGETARVSNGVLATVRDVAVCGQLR